MTYTFGNCSNGLFRCQVKAAPANRIPCFSLFSSHPSASSSQDVVRKTPAQIRNEKGAEQYKASSTSTMSSFLRISSRHVLDFKSFQPLLIIVLFVQPFQNDPGFNRKLSTSLVCSLSKRANNYNFNKFLRKPGQKQDPSGETREKLEKLAIQKNRLRNPLVGIDPNTINKWAAGRKIISTDYFDWNGPCVVRDIFGSPKSNVWKIPEMASKTNKTKPNVGDASQTGPNNHLRINTKKGRCSEKSGLISLQFFCQAKICSNTCLLCGSSIGSHKFRTSENEHQMSIASKSQESYRC